MRDCADPECGPCPTETGGATHQNYGAQRAVCTDGRDSDGDTLIDAADPDCANVLEEGSYSTCFDTLDNDNDGLIDCADTNCAWFCVENNGVGCYDGRDNDGNGVTDCADVQCTNTIYCVLESGGQSAQRGAECWDGVDNDFDGQFDCNDPQCASANACTEIGHCADNWDNDGNGLKDCRDPVCAGVPACLCIDTDGGAVYTTQGSITIGNVFSTDGGAWPGMLTHRYDYCDQSQPTKLHEFTCPPTPHESMFAAFPQAVDCTQQGYTTCSNGRCV